MKLHRIHIENYKGVTEQTLHVPDTGLVVVSGPNEVGKTSLIEALGLVFNTRNKHTAKKQAIKDAQPVGQHVPVIVEAEFSIGEHRVVHTKQFLVSPKAVLTYVDGPRTGDSFTGDDAIGEMERLISGMDDTLWTALQVLQTGGRSELTLDSSESLRAALDARSGATDTRRDDHGLFDLVKEEFQTYWTATGRPIRSRNDQCGQRDDLKAQLTGVEETLKQADLLVTELGELDEELAELRRHQAKAREELKEANDQQEGLRQLKDIVERTAQDELNAKLILTEATSTAKQRTELLSELVSLDERIAGSATDVKQAEELHHAVSQELEQTKSTMTKARSTRDKARDAVTKAEDLRTLLSQASKLAQLRRRRERVAALNEQIVELTREVNDHPITKRQLGQLRKDEQKARDAHAQVGLASPVLTAEELTEDAPELLLDGEPVESGGHYQIDQAVQLQVGSSWKMSLTPHAELETLRKDAEKYDTRLANRLADLHVESVSAAEDRCQAQQIAASRLKERTAQRDELLDGESMDTLDATIEQMSDQVASLRESTSPTATLDEGSRPSQPADSGDDTGAADTPAPDSPTTTGSEASCADLPDPDAQVQAAKAELATAEGQVAELEAQLNAIRERLDQARERMVAATTTMTGDQTRRAELAEKLHLAREQASDDDIQAQEEQARAAHRQAAEALDRARKDLADRHPEQMDQDVTDAQNRLTNVSARLTEKQSRQSSLRGQLTGMGREQLQDEADRIHTRIHHLDRQIRSVDQRAEAAKLLAETMFNARREQDRVYHEPLTRAINQIGTAIYHDGFSVRIDEELRISGRLLDGQGLGTGQLSSGAREQLGLIVRLAVANLVDPGDGVPLILDDALVYSDQRRARRIIQQMAAGATNCQIIVLTCDPERYDTLDTSDGITTVSLEPIRGV
ncbi:AAA family ATPase [Cutibacterium granulosum]|uniref:AAA family ATPase n=1 Tax=Cutibacterium granulosum TaxID=33011 RepID=UPI0027BA6290|nr:AAA family ATPase [Cutibacterium granulosum]